jgi:hypothetical protein
MKFLNLAAGVGSVEKWEASSASHFSILPTAAISDSKNERKPAGERTAFGRRSGSEMASYPLRGP